MPIDDTMRDQAETAIETAFFEEKRAFFASGATRDLRYRAEALRRLKAEIVRRKDDAIEALRLDFGKPKLESLTTEIGVVAEEIDYARRRLRRWAKPEPRGGSLSSFPTRFEVRKEPKGVALIVGPWNYPFQLVFSPLVGAIAAGNCAVLKPSHETAHVAALSIELVAAAFDRAFVSAVPGKGSIVVPALLERHRFDHVFFTGSPEVGRSVAAACASKLVPFTLELGGKSPAIVHRDADVADAARKIAWGKCINAGQTCVAPDYAIVHRSIEDRFVRELSKSISSFYGDDPSRSPDFARIVNDRRFSALSSLLEGQTVAAGGRTDPDARYIEPTIVVDPPLGSPLMGQEIFGPILPVLGFDDADEVRRIVARNPEPLALYVFTRDPSFSEGIFSSIRFGGGCVNNVVIHLANPRVPFGGVGNSGMGNYHGERGFAAFSDERTIARSGAFSANTLVFPPYGARKERLVDRL